MPSVGPPHHHTTAATLGALVFALHPLQVEAVAWVSGLKDVLSSFGPDIGVAIPRICSRPGKNGHGAITDWRQSLLDVPY